MLVQVPAQTGLIFYFQGYPNLAIPSPPLFMWLASNAFYLPARTSKPSLDMVVPIGKQNLIDASLEKVAISLQSIKFNRPTIQRAYISIDAIKFSRITGTVKYIILTNQFEFIWGREIPETVLDNEDIIYKDLDNDFLTLIELEMP